LLAQLPASSTTTLFAFAWQKSRHRPDRGEGYKKAGVARQLIRDSVAEMKKHLADPELNIAYEPDYYSGKIESYNDNCRAS